MYSHSNRSLELLLSEGFSFNRSGILTIIPMGGIMSLIGGYNLAHCEHTHSTKKKDIFFLSILGIGIVFYLGHLIGLFATFVDDKTAHLFHSFFELFNQMLWGIILGIVFVGMLGKVPREYISAVLGRPGSKKSILRATLAGLLLDLCSHGILMVGMKLYERGASLGQTMAFLIASPWNSLSLTLILISLIGLKWTLLFIALSGVIAIISGVIFDVLEKNGTLPRNPNEVELPENFSLLTELKNDWRKYKFKGSDLREVLWNGLKDSKMIIKWVLFGAILSSLLKVFIDQSVFQQYFGPSLLGLGLTLVFTTIMEVCSEGATPLAADLMTRASAPGNSFVFLMAGVSTDYTEIMSLKETTKSWKIALFLPLVTIPQVLLIGLILNGVIQL